MNKRSLIIIVICLLVIGAGVFILLTRNDAADPNGSVSSPPSTNEPSEPDMSGEPITLEGTLLCLPHKNTDGPQTMECAYGIQDASGTYYGLQDTTGDYSLLTKAAMGDTVRVAGFKVSKPSETYKAQATIKITALEKL